MRRVSLSFIAFCLSCVGFSQTPLIVGLNPGANPSAVAAQYGITYVQRAVAGGFALFNVPDANLDAVEKGMSADPNIAWYDLNDDFALSPTETESRGTVLPVVGDPTTLDKPNAALLSEINWSKSLTVAPGAPILVAVLDTGLGRNSALWKKVSASINFVGDSRFAYDAPSVTSTAPNANDGLGHGTMVANLINLIDPGNRYLIERVADSSGQASVWSIVEGIAFAARSGAKVCNISLGANIESLALTKVVAWASAQGMIIVAPIGNDGANEQFTPSRENNVVCLAGLDANSLKASFSNWNTDATSSAPAVGVTSIFWNGQLGVWSGTSFSAPLATGAIALAMRWGVNLTPGNAASALTNSGDSLDALNPGYSGMLGTRLNVANLCFFHPSSNP